MSHIESQCFLPLPTLFLPKAALSLSLFPPLLIPDSPLFSLCLSHYQSVLLAKPQSLDFCFSKQISWPVFIDFCDWFFPLAKSLRCLPHLVPTLSHPPHLPQPNPQVKRLKEMSTGRSALPPALWKADVKVPLPATRVSHPQHSRRRFLKPRRNRRYLRAVSLLWLTAPSESG